MSIAEPLSLLTKSSGSPVKVASTTQPSRSDILVADSLSTAHSTHQPCIHCGLPTSVPAGNSLDQSVFCCSGCRGAFDLIHGWGLTEYYALRDQMTVSGAALSAGTQSNYQQFDTPEYLGQSTPQPMADGCVTTQLGVLGLHCAACSWLIERALTNQSGLLSARVTMSDHTLRVIFDPNRIKLSGIARLLDRLGYQLLPLDGSGQLHMLAENRRHLIRIAMAGFLAANAMWIAVALYAGQFSGVAAEHKYFFELMGMALGTVAVVGPGRTFLTGAVAAIKTRTPHMDMPIALALSIGTTVGLWNAVNGVGQVYFDGLSMLVFLLLIGRWIQFRQQQQAAKSVALMLRVTPRHARLIDQEGNASLVLLERLSPGDCIQVAVGESLPADGHIVTGASRLNRSLLTGESEPVRVQHGDWVEAGTINIESPLVVKVAATGMDSRIGRVMQAVELASTEKTPIVRLADRIAGHFVVAVIVLSFITFALWLPESLADATNFATAMLIVACPCALALATPLAIAVGIGRSARAKILVREGTVFQQLSKPGRLWLDKTGTLTEGRQQARLVWGSTEALHLAIAVENQCQHPIARAIVSAAQSSSAPSSPTAQDVQSISGGVRGNVVGQDVLVGNLNCMEAQHVHVPASDVEKIEQLLAQGESPIMIAVDGTLVGLLGLSDPVRSQATELISHLRRFGWSVGMLSGDHPEIAARVGRQIGLAPDECRGGVTPEEKLAAIEQSRDNYPTVVMVGDGANDAAALAAADVGIAMRGGAEVSLLAAPVYLASNQLMDLVLLLRGSKATTRIVYINFVVSLTYNLMAVALTLAGLISPLLAAILMPVSSATVLGMTFLIPSFTSPETVARV